MRRRARRSILRQRVYTAILAEHSERDEFFAHRAEIEAQMLTVEAPDPRDPVEIAKAAAQALKGAA